MVVTLFLAPLSAWRLGPEEAAPWRNRTCANTLLHVGFHPGLLGSSRLPILECPDPFLTRAVWSDCSMWYRAKSRRGTPCPAVTRTSKTATHTSQLCRHRPVSSKPACWGCPHSHARPLLGFLCMRVNWPQGNLHVPLSMLQHVTPVTAWSCCLAVTRPRPDLR